LTKAAELAQLEHRPLHVIHAEQAPVGTSRMVFRGFDNLPELIREEAESTLNKAVEGARNRFPDLELSSDLPEGDPREALQAASDVAAAVVVGSRGVGGFRHLPLGSVSLWVSQHAHCTTIVVRPDAAEDAAAPIVVGTDTTEVSAHALPFAFEQASFRGRPLVVAHSFDEQFQGGYGVTNIPDEDLEGLDEERRAISESIAGLREKFVDVDVTTHLGRGPAAGFLVHASERAEMLVVGSRQRSAAATIWSGAVSRNVVEHARCTVAVVPSSG
jgi:nucleotide-binding universal stress UspA family protein